MSIFCINNIYTNISVINILDTRIFCRNNLSIINFGTNINNTNTFNEDNSNCINNNNNLNINIRKFRSQKINTIIRITSNYT